MRLLICKSGPLFFSGLVVHERGALLSLDIVYILHLFVFLLRSSTWALTFVPHPRSEIVAMLFSLTLLPLFLGMVSAGCVYANKDAKENTHSKDLRKRSFDQPIYPRDANRTLIGDLRYNITTPTGQSIANILLAKETGQNLTVTSKPTTTKACKADKCCVWYSIAANLTQTFRQNFGCGDLARQAIRAGFHDAATWSSSREAKGRNCCGADGSLLLSGSEINNTENLGLELIPGLLMPLYKDFKVGMADLIQYAANHATVSCTQGPRVRTYVGRKDSKKSAPTGLLPEPDQSADYIISLFADKTIISDDLIALVGAHSTAKQFFVNTTLAGEPLDQSPGVWDIFYYSEMLTDQPPSGVFRLASDKALSESAVTAAKWNAFATGTQNAWNEAYSTAYVRLSMLGVDNINELTECTGTLPMAIQD